MPAGAVSQMLTHGYYAPTYTPLGVEDSFRGKKPYLVGESGSVEDPNTPGRKGQWMTDMGNYAKTYMPGLYAIVYFDCGNAAWNLDTSTSSMDGFRSFANDPYFTIPNQYKEARVRADRRYGRRLPGHLTTRRRSAFERIRSSPPPTQRPLDATRGLVWTLIESGAASQGAASRQRPRSRYGHNMAKANGRMMAASVRWRIESRSTPASPTT